MEIINHFQTGKKIFEIHTFGLDMLNEINFITIPCEQGHDYAFAAFGVLCLLRVTRTATPIR